MLGGPERVYKNIKDLFGLTYHPDRFDYFRIDPNLPLVQKGDFEKYNLSHKDIKYILFAYYTPGKRTEVLKIPYADRFKYQDFLNSGDEKDLPEGGPSIVL